MTLQMLLGNLILRDLEDEDEEQGANESAEDDDDDVEVGTMKPVRITAGAAIQALIEECYEKTTLVAQLSPLVQQLLSAAEYENEIESNNDAPLVLLQLVVSTAEEEVLPHAQAVATVLIGRLCAQVDAGEDLSMCTALEVLSVLTEALHEMEADGTEMQELSGWLCCALVPVLGKYWSQDSGDDDDGAIYLPEMCRMLHYVFTHRDATQESKSVSLIIFHRVAAPVFIRSANLLPSALAICYHLRLLPSPLANFLWLPSPLYTAGFVGAFHPLLRSRHQVSRGYGHPRIAGAMGTLQ
jgi:hypothetical protein